MPKIRCDKTELPRYINTHEVAGIIGRRPCHIGAFVHSARALRGGDPAYPIVPARRQARPRRRLMRLKDSVMLHHDPLVSGARPVTILARPSQSERKSGGADDRGVGDGQILRTSLSLRFCSLYRLQLGSESRHGEKE